MKDKIKIILNKLGIYSLARETIVKVYYPYKYYRIKANVGPILKRLHEVFDENVEDYWLDYGTLLGYVREGRIIKGDLDLDFGIKPKSGVELSRILAQHDIKLTQQTIVEGKTTMEQYSYKGIGFDIFYYREDGDKMITNIWFYDDLNEPQRIAYEKGKGSISETTFSNMGTKEIEFYGYPFRIPEDSDKYLAEHFGSDYMIPNPNWTYKDEVNRKNIDKEFEVRFL